MDNTSKVSVIIPVCKATKYLDKCLNSVVNQSYKNLEIFLVIKAGDEATKKCIGWQKNDWRIILISRYDIGLGDARNYAFELATGKYIAYVDADDWLELDYIEKLLIPLEKYPEVEFSCCGFDRNDEINKSVDSWIPSRQGIVPNGRWSSYVTVWLRMYRKAFLENNGITFFYGSHEDDAYYWLVKAYAKYGYYIPEILYHYNQGNVQSLMHIKNERMKYFDAMEFTIKKLQSKNRIIPWKGWMLHEIIACIPYKIYNLEDKDKGRRIAREFLRKYFPIDDIILFGAGKDARDYLIRHYELNIKYIIDNDPMKIGKELLGKIVKPFNVLLREECLVVIASSANCDAMERQLEKNGYYYYLEMNEFEYIRKECLVYQ